MPLIREYRSGSWRRILGAFALGALVALGAVAAVRARVNQRYAPAFYRDSTCPEIGIVSGYTVGILDSRTGRILVRNWTLRTSVTGCVENVGNFSWELARDVRSTARLHE